ALLPSKVSLAVIVGLPAVLSVTLNVFVPATSAAGAGKAALVSLEVIAAVSVTVLTRFQSASTALTVTVNAVPAVWAVGVPGVPVPGGVAVTVAVKVTDWLNTEGLAEDASAVEVLALLTVCENGEPVLSLPLKLTSPL